MTSFPYLQLARRYGADYGEVLSYADLYDKVKATEHPSYWQKQAALSLPFVVKRAIENEVLKQRAR